jgi:MFS family permease
VTASPTASRYWQILGALWIVEFLGTFESNMIYAAVNHLRADLGDGTKVGWLITSYLLVASGAAAVAGRLGDLYGRKRVMLILVAAGIIGSTMSALAPNYPMLVAGRALQGLCGAILPLTIGLARETLPAHRLSTGIGIMLTGTTIGTASGLVLGGIIVDSFSWHGIFVASAVTGVVGFLAIYTVLPASVRRIGTVSVPWFEAIFFTTGVLLLVAAITYAPTWGISNRWILGFAAAALVLLTIWVRMSLTAKEPLIDLRLLAMRPVLIVNLSMILVAMGALQITLVFSTLLQAPAWTLVGLGVTATVAGLVKLPSNISSTAAAPLCGWLIARIGPRATLVISGVIGMVGWLAGMAFHHSVGAIVAILCLISFGTTMMYAAGPTILAMMVPPDRTSEAAGMTTVLRQAFTGVGAQLVTVLLATMTIAAPGMGSARYPTEGAYLLTMGVIAGLCGLVALMALALPARLEQQTLSQAPA